MSGVRPSLVIVGAGPRGTGLLERIAANAPELYAGSGLGEPGVDVHLVDPFPPGGGRIWREEQPPLLWMNSQAQDVTMFTDVTVDMAGPVRQGPTLHEWAELDGRVFADRQRQGGYLRWVYERTVAALPPGIRVRHPPHRPVRVEGPRTGRQQVWLYAEGAAATPEGLLAVDPADGRVLDRAGAPHPRRFALGPHTDARGSGAFTRPRTGGPAFRQNDATARAALAFLRALSCSEAA